MHGSLVLFFSVLCIVCDIYLNLFNQGIPLDMYLWYFHIIGARESSFRNIKTIAECLADELMNAAKVSVIHCHHCGITLEVTHCLWVFV